MDHIGIDVHKIQSQVCILNERGERIEFPAELLPRLVQNAERATRGVHVASKVPFHRGLLPAGSRSGVVDKPKLRPLGGDRPARAPFPATPGARGRDFRMMPS